VGELRLWITVSLDGFVACLARLHEWVFPLAAWRQAQGLTGGEVNESSPVIEAAMADIGATVMGHNMSGRRTAAHTLPGSTSTSGELASRITSTAVIS